MKWNYNKIATDKNRQRTGFGDNGEDENPLPEELCNFINELVNIRTESFYYRFYAKVFFLPKSLQIELLKSELLKLNELLSDERIIRLNKGEDATQDHFIVRFLYDWLFDEEFEIYKTFNRIHKGEHFPYQGDEEKVIIQMPRINDQLDDEVDLWGLPRFNQLLCILTNLNHFKSLVRIYEEMERGGEMPTPQVKIIKPMKDTEQTCLYNELTENSYWIPKETRYNDFCHTFGGNVKPDDFKLIMWYKNVQLLRELLLPLKHPDISQATMEKEAGNYFVDKKGKPRPLAKDNPKPDPDRDHLIAIMKKLATL